VSIHLRLAIIRILSIALFCHACQAVAHAADVSARFELQSQRNSQNDGHRHTEMNSPVVMWLSPLDQNASSSFVAPVQNNYRLVQKDKQFSPHLLVVPTGSNVDFPNMDPFFHNVFSLFNGKRFDLGLYEAGSHRVVRFDREGVSYIFCNIHPEMGAVILSVSTPYFGTSGSDGKVTIHNVPPGSYRLSVWSENAQPTSLAAVSRTIHVASEDVHLGSMQIETAANPKMKHKNKFGEDYPVERSSPY
jgi:plastocyanin